MKKNLPVSKSTSDVPSKQLSQEEKSLKKTIDDTKEKIKKGIEKPTASTGTPVNELYGAAKTTATLSNIGGGSKETGGGGMEKGLGIITDFTAATAKLDGMQFEKKLDKKKLK